MNLITRKEAKEGKLTKYFTGKPCVKGHIAERRVANGYCLTCDGSSNRARHKINCDENNARNRKLREEKPELWRNKTASYRARKLRALPKWSDKEKVKEIYLKCPVGFEVDHIIPLKGDLVSGLHNEFNLQYLTAKDNQSKSNRFVIGETNYV